MEQTAITLVVALLVAVISLGVNAKGAKAASGPDFQPTWAAWKFEATPDNGKIDARWTITIGGEDKQGDSVELHQQQFPLKCTPVGDVLIGSDEISFNGGHIECQFPGLIDTANSIIRNLWGPQYELNIGPDCGCMPLVTPYAPFVEIDAIVTGKGANPVFFHPSISAGMPASDGNVANHLTFAGETSTSPEAKPRGETTFRSTYECDNGSCLFEHYQDSQLVGQDKRNHNPTFYTGSTTAFIGKFNSGSERFQGVVKRIIIDPGCRGT